MWQAAEMLVEAMGVMRVFLNDAHAARDAQATGHDIRDSGKGKDANYTVG